MKYILLILVAFAFSIHNKNEELKSIEEQQRIIEQQNIWVEAGIQHRTTIKALNGDCDENF